MEMLRACVLSIGIQLIVGCPDLRAEDVPAIELPKPLAPYADVENVIGAATAVIKLLGTATFEEAAADGALAKAPCNTQEMGGFYRGMTLMQAGYFIFINKMSGALNPLTARILRWERGLRSYPRASVPS